MLIAPSAPPALFLRWFAVTFGLSESVPARMGEQIESREAVALAEFEPEWLGPRINQRSLVIHDRGDRVAPFSAAEQVVRWLTDGRLLPTEGLGHRRVLDDRAVAREIVAHLAICPSTPPARFPVSGYATRFHFTTT